MPELIQPGPFSERKDRFPHATPFTCHACGGRFKLTTKDTDEGYYSASSRSVERGDQRDSYMLNIYFIKFPCPYCGQTLEAQAPEKWTLDFAQGRTAADRAHSRLRDNIADDGYGNDGGKQRRITRDE